MQKAGPETRSGPALRRSQRHWRVTLASISAVVAEVEDADHAAVAVHPEGDTGAARTLLHDDRAVVGGVHPQADRHRRGEAGAADQALAGPGEVALVDDGHLVAVHQVAGGDDLLVPALRHAVDAGLEVL